MTEPREGERPEALATFAAAARSGGKKPDDLGLEADERTAPIPADPKAGQANAARILQEGATGRRSGAEQTVDELPDRIIESRRPVRIRWRNVGVALVAAASGLLLIGALISGFGTSAEHRRFGSRRRRQGPY